MALDKNSLAELYAKRATLYDLTANVYYLVGFREFAYRKKAILALELKRGDTVVRDRLWHRLEFQPPDRLHRTGR